VEHGEALRFLGGTAQTFEIVFLDPPFASDLLTRAGQLLEEQRWLSANALIYVETDAAAGLPPLPATWVVTRTKRAGAVGYHLLTRGDSGA
jgi:16S rRNA (guanine966-N2)-methyltransferase